MLTWIAPATITLAIAAPQQMVALPAQAQDLYSAQAFAQKYLNPKKAKTLTTVESVYVEKGFALIGWSQGEAAGQLLLKKQGKTWKVLSSGGGAMNLATLTSHGLPQATAEELLSQADPNWRNYEP
jgi:fructose-1,6-bisphosphatase/inositol monophosphatase family enzyme